MFKECLIHVYLNQWIAKPSPKLIVHLMKKTRMCKISLSTYRWTNYVRCGSYNGNYHVRTQRTYSISHPWGDTYIPAHGRLEDDSRIEPKLDVDCAFLRESYGPEPSHPLLLSLFRIRFHAALSCLSHTYRYRSRPA